MNTLKNHLGVYEVWLQCTDPVIESVLPYLIKIDSLYYVPHYSWDVIGDLLVATDNKQYGKVEILLDGYSLFMSDYYDILGIIKLLNKRKLDFQITINNNFRKEVSTI